MQPNFFNGIKNFERANLRKKSQENFLSKYTDVIIIITMIPKGFLFAGVNCGIKREGLDLGIIFSQNPAEWAGMFTTNAFKAGPVIVSRSRAKNKVRAIIVNSGIANAGTGEKGVRDAESICRILAENLRIKPDEVLVASTGIIGKTLPLDKIQEGIEKAIVELSPEGFSRFAKAIMTTDKFPKIVEKTVVSEKKDIGIIGIAKGAGMLHPKLATMLVFLLTDAKAPAELLKSYLKEAVDSTFHCLTIDGDTSTNDSVFLLANGVSGVEAGEEFKEALLEVCENLSEMIARDGEGATKLIKIKVKGASSKEMARSVGRKIAISPLVKTAFFGEDPNVGRILCAIGNSPYPIEPEKIDVYLGGFKVICKGIITDFPSEELKSYLANPEIEIEVELGMGESAAVVRTCDLSYEYVRLNAEYTT